MSGKFRGPGKGHEIIINYPIFFRYSLVIVFDRMGLLVIYQ